MSEERRGRRPGTIPLACAIAAYIGGFCAAAFAVFGLMTRHSRSDTGATIAFVSSFGGCILAAVLNTVATVGGIVGTIRNVRKPEPRGWVYPACAIVLGTVGLVGVVVLLMIGVLSSF